MRHVRSAFLVPVSLLGLLFLGACASAAARAGDDEVPTGEGGAGGEEAGGMAGKGGGAGKGAAAGKGGAAGKAGTGGAAGAVGGSAGEGGGQTGGSAGASGKGGAAGKAGTGGAAGKSGSGGSSGSAGKGGAAGKAGAAGVSGKGGAAGAAGVAGSAGKAGAPGAGAGGVAGAGAGGEGGFGGAAGGGGSDVGGAAGVAGVGGQGGASGAAGAGGASAPVCGNGVIEAGEECDGGGSGKWCTGSCEVKCQFGARRGTHCYELIDFGNKNWVDAQAFCNLQSPGFGHLVTFDEYVSGPQVTPEEDWVVDSILEPATNSSVWVGVSDRTTEGLFLRYDGQPVPYTRWWQDEPNDAGGGEDCVELDRKSGNWGWNDNECGDTKLFVCEYDPVAGK